MRPSLLVNIDLIGLILQVNEILMKVPTLCDSRFSGLLCSR